MGIEYITAEEAALMIGVTPRIIYHRIRTGALQAVKSDSTDKRQKWMLDRAEIEKIRAEKQLTNTDIYTQSEYARLIGNSRQRVFQLIQRGALQTVIIDGRRMIVVAKAPQTKWCK